MNKEKLEWIMNDGRLRTRVELFSSLLATIEPQTAGREGLQETPARMAKLYDEVFNGYTVDAHQVLHDATFTEADADTMVLVKEIPFYSTCEHHMEPIIGVAAVAYIPRDGKIVGLSKIVRVVEAYARRLQVQERLGKQVLNTINEVLNPLGAAVVIQARHLCMERRGVQKPGTITVTSALSGVFRENESRDELMSMLEWKNTL